MPELTPELMPEAEPTSDTAASLRATCPRIPGRRDRLIMLLLAALVMSCYCWVINHDFTTYDDPDNVTEIKQITSGLTWSNVSWCFTQLYEANWNPISRLSHIIVWQAFGDFAGAHAFTNVVFHCINTLLVFWVLRQLTGRVYRAAVVALLFGIHPVHVESVAWISERKDVLFVFFGLLSLWAYAAYARGPTRMKYAMTLGLFTLSLMSKPMLVTMPALLLLLDFWALGRIDETWFARENHGQLWGRIKPLLFEKAPFLLISLAISIVTLVAQDKGGAVQSTEAIPIGLRLSNALIAYVQYLGKLIWPVNLAVLYPMPDEGYPVGWIVGSWVILLLVTGFVLLNLKRYPALLFGWFWFLVSLIPVIGLVQVGSQAFADRYLYWPVLGIDVAVVWGIAEWLRPVRPVDQAAGRDRSFLAVVVLLILTCVLWMRTYQQVAVWQNSESLYRQTIEATDRNHLIDVNMAALMANSGRWVDARAYYNLAIKDSPTDLKAFFGLASMDKIRGDLPAVIQHYKDAIQAVPDMSPAYVRLGTLLMEHGQIQESRPYFEKAVQIDPDAGIAQANLGVILIREGHADLAVDHLRRAAKLIPDKPEILMNLGGALAEMGRLTESEEQFRKLVEQYPNMAEARLNLGVVLLNTGRFDEASNEFREVLRLRPGLKKAADLLEQSEKSKRLRR